MSLLRVHPRRLTHFPRRLVELLSSDDALILAISAHDLGQFVKHGGDRAKQ